MAPVRCLAILASLSLCLVAGCDKAPPVAAPVLEPAPETEQPVLPEPEPEVAAQPAGTCVLDRRRDPNVVPRLRELGVAAFVETDCEGCSQEQRPACLSAALAATEPLIGLRDVSQRDRKAMFETAAALCTATEMPPVAMKFLVWTLGDMVRNDALGEALRRRTDVPEGPGRARATELILDLVMQSAVVPPSKAHREELGMLAGDAPRWEPLRVLLSKPPAPTAAAPAPRPSMPAPGAADVAAAPAAPTAPSTQRTES